MTKTQFLFDLQNEQKTQKSKSSKHFELNENGLQFNYFALRHNNEDHRMIENFQIIIISKCRKDKNIYFMNNNAKILELIFTCFKFSLYLLFRKLGLSKIKEKN